jgi:hypothetical protein
MGAEHRVDARIGLQQAERTAESRWQHVAQRARHDEQARRRDALQACQEQKRAMAHRLAAIDQTRPSIRQRTLTQ